MNRNTRIRFRLASAAVAFLIANPQPVNADEVSLPSIRAIERDIQNSASSSIPATVGIGSHGTGVIVTADGYVLTVNHVLPKGVGTVELQLHDGRKTRARVLGGDEAIDARILKIEAPGPWPYASMGKREPKGGEWVIGLGNAGGVDANRPAQVRAGRVLDVGKEGLRTDCAMGPGDSGGPLLDREGRVIAIHRSADARHTDHIPIALFASAWDEWTSPGAPKISRDDARSAFQQVAKRSAQSVLRLHSNNKPAALGTVVSKDGLLISKSSELREPILLEDPTGKMVKAVVVGRSGVHDVVLLKVDPRHLGGEVRAWDVPSARRALASRLGRFVAVAAPAGQLPLAVGVVSSDAGLILDLATRLGMELDEVKNGPGVRVIGLTPKGVAEESGMLVHDVFTHINGNEVATRDDLFEEFNRPGQQSINIIMKRGDHAFKATFPLSNPGIHATDARVNRRRNGFPMCFQHDAPLSPEDCGGPLVDLDGDIIGINIARASHSASLAIPVDVMRDVVRELQTQYSAK